MISLRVFGLEGKRVIWHGVWIKLPSVSVSTLELFAPTTIYVFCVNVEVYSRLLSSHRWYWA